MSTAEIHNIDSAYMIEFGHVAGGFRVKDLSGDTAPYTYTPPYGSYIHYYTAYGVWRRTTGNGKWEFSRSKINPDYRPVIIRECGIPIEPRVRHYDTMSDDVILEGKPTITAQVQETVEWYKKAKKELALRNADRRWHDAVQALARQSKKEVKDKMRLQVYDVILFNRESKQIDFREDMIAETPEEVYLLAVQKFGKYDPKVHVKQAIGILSFDEIKEK